MSPEVVLYSFPAVNTKKSKVPITLPLAASAKKGLTRGVLHMGTSSGQRACLRRWKNTGSGSETLRSYSLSKGKGLIPNEINMWILGYLCSWGIYAAPRVRNSLDSELENEPGAGCSFERHLLGCPIAKAPEIKKEILRDRIGARRIKEGND